MAVAWESNPDKLLHLICLIRDPRHGMGNKKCSLVQLEWLKEHKPLTYASNIKTIAERFGRYGDLVEMAHRCPGNNQLELQLLASQLQVDKANEHVMRPSLAAKWAPTEGGRFSPLVRPLANLIFPGDPQALKRYRTEILSPLRKRLAIVEHFLTNQIQEVDVKLVPNGALIRFHTKLRASVALRGGRQQRQEFSRCHDHAVSKKTEFEARGKSDAQLGCYVGCVHITQSEK